MARTVSAALAALTLLVLAAPPAGAQFEYDPGETTYDQAEVFYPFPVYRPTRAIAGMGFHLRNQLCYANDAVYPHATYGYARDRAGRRPQYAIWQYDRNARCGSPRDTRTVRTVRIDGKRVAVKVFCIDDDSCTVADGRRAGFVVLLRKPPTTIGIRTFNTGLKRLLRLARGFERVDLTRPVVRLGTFTNPDQTILCNLFRDPGTGPEGGQARHHATCGIEAQSQGGLLLYDGRFDLCLNGSPSPCMLEWFVKGTHALAAGQRSRMHGYECLVEAAAVTCTIVSGDAKGRGFTTSLAGASEIVPP